MSSRAERIGLNEAVFREVNERIEGLAQTFQLGSEQLDLICECGDATCTQRVRLSAGEYEQLRSESDLFAVSPGHVAPDVESVVEQRSGYDVVKKDEGRPRRIAEQTDPRTE
jgi:hypothetical protein